MKTVTQKDIDKSKEEFLDRIKLVILANDQYLVSEGIPKEAIKTKENIGLVFNEVVSKLTNPQNV